MVRKRLYALLIAAMLLLLSLLGCTPEATDPPSDGSTPPSEPTETDGVTVTDQYVIVFPRRYNLYIDRAVYALQTAIEQQTGIRPEAVSEREEATAQEIVLGYCDRFDAETVTAPIMLQDERIVFAISDPAELYFTASSFVDNCVAAGAVDTEGRLCLTEQTLADVAKAETVQNALVTVLSQNLRYANDSGGNSVAERSERFAALVQEYAPDIIGTQEATPLWTQYLEQHFSDRYGMIGVFRDKSGHGDDEANYILYRKDRFAVEESGTFWLEPEDPDELGRVEGALCNRICTWALLKDLHTDETLLVCNTHLDHSNDTVRQAQIEVLLDYLAFDLDFYPVILTGDFNMLRDSEPYRTVTKAGLLDGQRNAWVDASAVDHTCHLYGESGSLIDFCFYSKDWIPFYATITDKSYGGYVSDHYGVLTQLLPIG